MAVSRTLLVVLILSVAQTCCSARPVPAAEPPWQVGRQPFPDTEEFFDRLFGKEREQDRKALAEIEVSVREEGRMGETAVRAYLAHLERQKIRVASRGKDVQYLRDLVETIRPLMDNSNRYRSIKVYLAESSRCDARSFPGGTLVFFRGLLESADSEAAVIGIVGHELSHLDRGHHLWRLRRIKLAQQTFSEGPHGFSPDRFFATGTMLMRMFMRPFRPEDEAEADRDGARWAYLAGYDPREMARLFLKLRDRHKHQRVPIPSFFQTHPAPEGRHKAIMDLYRELQQAKPNQRLYIGKENLRRRIARARREFKQ